MMVSMTRAVREVTRPAVGSGVATPLAASGGGEAPASTDGSPTGRPTP